MGNECLQVLEFNGYRERWQLRRQVWVLVVPDRAVLAPPEFVEVPALPLWYTCHAVHEEVHRQHCVDVEDGQALRHRLRCVCPQNGHKKADCAGEMAQDIYQNGPITGTFKVYMSFLTYKSGVYQHIDGEKQDGLHAIKI